MRHNASKLATILFIAISILYAAYIWHTASSWEDKVTSDDLWYSQPELSRMEVRDAYDRAFKKIILVDGIMFASAFLLLFATNRKST